jgi:hypothetical protein
VFFSEQCWPVKQRSALAVLSSQVGLTQLKLMFAEARPARAPRPKRVVLIMKDDDLEAMRKPTEHSNTRRPFKGVIAEEKYKNVRRA